MRITELLIISLVLFGLAYRFYSPWIAKRLGLDPGRPTPAHTMPDGVDYCPARAPVLFGHHFASIAGAAPIVGPIAAAAYGWLPVLLWIIFGGIFLGAVHDFATLMASIRHSGRSMGEVISKYVGWTGGKIFLVFLWATLVLLIACYLAVVSKTFAAEPPAGTSSVLFIFLALLFGLTIYRLKAPLGVSTFVGVAALAACIVLGWYYPIVLSPFWWTVLLLIYIYAASVAPVWILLQPRDFLNSFLLYALVAAALVGYLLARPAIELPAFVAFTDAKLGPLFPILFVTVACGAISGFHSVVSAGTTAKQLGREEDARPIGFGAMIVESLVAVLALFAAMMLTREQYGVSLSSQGPVALFSNSIGSLLSTVGIPAEKGTTFAALAVSAFILTTLDTATRLCRFALQELFTPKAGGRPPLVTRNRYIATLFTVAPAAALAYSGHWETIWPIFGSANQLLAALALLAVALWLRHSKRKTAFLGFPMVAMFLITLSALGLIAYRDSMRGNYALGSVAMVLFVLAVTLMIEAVRSLRREYGRSPA